MRVRILITGIAAIGVLGGGNGYAAESGQRQSDMSSDKFSIAVGGFFADTETNIRVDSSDGTFGTSLNLENALDLGTSDISIDISMMWRISEKHSLELEYFNIGRSGSSTLNAEITFGDTTFAEQLDVNSFLDTEVLRIGYGYSLWHTNSYELGLHIGLHITKVETGIGAIYSGGQVLNEVVGTTAPLPVIGLYGTYRIAERWLMFGRLQYFQLEFDKYDGSMAQFIVGVEHDTFNRISFGAGYRSFDIAVDIDETEWVGKIDFKYTGPVLYFRYGF